jgi:hypothetical protein
LKHASPFFPKEVTHPLREKEGFGDRERNFSDGFVRIHSKSKKLLYLPLLPETSVIKNKYFYGTKLNREIGEDQRWEEEAIIVTIWTTGST